VTSLARSPLVPDYPTLGEAGVENFQLEIWTAAAGPATMPQPIIDRLSKLIGEITRTPEVRQRLHLDGYEAVGSPADVLAARIKADTALLSNIIVTQGVRLE
jgi:tripartite-type tricarboxylate transporter receptor subunit TctC